jgi:hypothetical protein
VKGTKSSRREEPQRSGRGKIKETVGKKERKRQAGKQSGLSII